MRPQKLTFLLLLALLAFAMAGCEKNPFAPDTELPPETTTGANTFGCLVNGKVWRNGGVSFPYSSITIDLNNSNLLISATRKLEDTMSGIKIYIFIPDIVLGQFACDSLNVNITYSNSIKGVTCWYNYTYDGFIEITRYDLENGIVSGRFNAKLKLDGNKEIVITNGRFDLKN